jgi:hypothetical protein
MMELIHLTARYSNAVLVAVLPHISQFAAKLDLPIPQSITPDQVARSTPSPYKGYIADGVILTNGYWFLFHWLGPDGGRGLVQGFRAPTNWFFEQEFTDESAAKYFGEDRMTTNEVISMARDTLTKLGFKPELTHSHEAPTLEGPFDIQRLHRHVPYCRVIWEWPKTENPVDLNRIRVEINLQTKALVGLDLLFSRTNNPPATPIKVDVVPELERDYQKRMKASGKMFFNTNAPPRFPQKSL